MESSNTSDTSNPTLGELIALFYDELVRVRADETEKGPEDPLEALPAPAPHGPLD